MAEEALLILDISESHDWQTGGLGSLCRIPPEKRPTVLQVSREVAEKEALRLQQAHPNGRFVVFAPVAATTLVDMPTHVNLEGKTIYSSKVARLVEVHNPNEIPF